MRRWVRRTVAGGSVAAVLLGSAYGTAHLLTSQSAFARAVAWGESDVGDQHRFPARTVAAGEASPLRSGAEPAATSLPVPGQDRGWDELLEANGTSSFLVVHRDRLVYERYFDGATPSELQTSFSAAKSVLSTLVGIAVDEGRIGSVTDPVTAYVPELAERDPRFERVTIRHLLTMSSGIAYEERGLPWSDDALTYYAPDLRDLAVTHTRIERAPGEEWLYNNYNPLLLGLVLERAVGMPVADYMATRLWQPMGAEADATWSLDSEDSGFEKMESGVNARPRDFARFGQLMLHQGRLGGREIISRGWVRDATAPSTVADPADFYQYLWWVDDDWFSARGKYGQYVAVFPRLDVVVVRTGSSEGSVDWPAVIEQVAELVGRSQMVSP